LRSGSSFDQLTASEKAKVGRLNDIVEQYIAADKYVFVSPIWNFSFPPVLKAYIDAVCIAAKPLNIRRMAPSDYYRTKKPFIFKQEAEFIPKDRLRDSKAVTAILKNAKVREAAVNF
jgi:FMN-dependent NADH-azoreductase